ncbi:GroES-like protein [Lindgomyces ingoldianus]|uniref:GroES-like protein n=1 Tax=Lindgomyces ingoldianus TaxID=673940 RepID=A0ACB6RF62_9PLEO|nr:GroES-like protein [Lindgomyces ingoldianus]KAF2477690.1 GroES-like protein [Lindgomyces ingoldianus]
MSSITLPPKMKALVQEVKGDPLILKSVPTPQATHGAVVVQVLASLAHPNLPKILSKEGLIFTYPIPFTPGDRSVGRVAATGPDTTSLPVGQLVMVEPWFRARDNSDVQILFGAFDGSTPAAKTWMADNWRYAAYAEYVKTPLENTWALNENRLCKELGYSIPELLQLTVDVVAYGGLRGIDIKAGERLIVAPATGMFSGATVGVAVAMGVSVIAVGRNIEVLKKLKETCPEQIEIVVLTGDLENDKAAMMRFGPVDALLEMSPAEAGGSNYVRAAFGALRQYGRASIMGYGTGLMADIEIPYMEVVFKNLRIQGQCMYEREHVRGLVKLAESGALKLGNKRGDGVKGTFKLEEVDELFKGKVGVGSFYALTPWKE